MRIKFFLGYINTQVQTTLHKFWVAYYLFKYYFLSKKISCHETQLSDIPKISFREMLTKAIMHDLSKYCWVEAKGFAQTIFELKNTTYGTKEYGILLSKIKPCLDNHYKKNSHHPEFHKNKVENMPDDSLVEMICDWKAATRRHKDGDIQKSLIKNKVRWNITKEYMTKMYNILFIIDCESFKDKY